MSLVVHTMPKDYIDLIGFDYREIESARNLDRALPEKVWLKVGSFPLLLFFFKINFLLFILNTSTC